MPNKVLIYVLKDPETKKPRYVGQSYDPYSRLLGHIEASKYQRSPVEKWIHSLILKNQKPIVEILEECYDHSHPEREDYWIDRLSNDNELLNRNRISKESKGQVNLDDRILAEMVSMTQAAALLGVTRQTIYNWTNSGLKSITKSKTKFIKRADLLAFEPGKAGRKKESK